MAFDAGSRFGPYEIAELIGHGGMGEVYRARDPELDRDVAIKVMPALFASDENRVARFEQEARTLASLNHVNIAQVYGLARSDGQTAIVMELVEGPTLADRIAEGALPADEALGIAMQIADALAAAHERQIVHRDLKPANIKLKPDGVVKVLDFGIAKAVESPIGASGTPAPALTTPAMTQAGVILGTAAYMSPEQARGKPVDQRSDIWAFGCVLYEMLTGQPAFGGSDVPETLARIIAQDASIDTLPGMVSPAVRHTIGLCLTKDAKKRVADIRDVRLALGGAFESAFTSLGSAAGAHAQPLWRRAAGAAAILVAGAALASLAWWAAQPAAEPELLNRFTYLIPNTQGLRQTARSVLTLSLNGRRFAYNTQDGIYVRDMGELDARLIIGTERSAAAPAMSPDGSAIVFASFGSARFGELVKIAITGGAPVTLASGIDDLQGIDWSIDGTIVFADGEGIKSVSANGGTPDLVVAKGDYDYLAEPQLLPDGDSVLFAGKKSGGPWNDSDAEIVIASIATGESKVLIQGGGDPQYLSSGHLMYALEDGLFAIRFDLPTWIVSGGAVPLLQGLSRSNAGSANYDVAADGTLVYLSGASTSLRNLFWVDRDGRAESINAPARSYNYVALSPDGTLAAMDVRDEENDIWIWDFERETLQRLTFDPGLNRGVAWDSEGRVAFSREIGAVEEVYRQPAEGFGTAEQLTIDSPSIVIPNEFTPDGRLIYQTGSYPRDILITTLGEDGPVEGAPLIATDADEAAASLSPNGRWLAFHSNESGQWEIYIRPYPEVDSGRRQISTNGGVHPLWNADGTELFYMNLNNSTQGTGEMYAVPMQTEDRFAAGTPTRLFDGAFAGGNFKHPYDVSGDGQRFLMVRPVASSERAEIIILQNVLDELERLAPAE